MKKYKYLIYLISFITCFSSCDFLDLEPEDGVTREKYWNTEGEVKDAVMGCYAAIMKKDDKDYTKAAIWKFFAWGEGRADIATNNPLRIESNWLNMKNGDLTETNKYVSWGELYTVINNCNTVLKFAKETQEIDQSFTMERLKEFEAEVVCIRSLMYFYLVRAFGDVPYIVDASLDDDQNFIVPKSKKEDILDSLIVSLKRVDRSQNGTNMGIPYDYGSNPANNKGRFTVWGLKALLADIYLWKEDYENCIQQCNQIIASDRYALVPIISEPIELETSLGTTTVYYPSDGSIDAYFSTMYAQGNSIESILELQYTTDYENPFWFVFNNSSGFVSANTEYLRDYMFPSSQIDRGWYDIRGSGVSYQQTTIWKWLGMSRSDPSQQRSNGESFSNWIFYRLADVYLMKAEALTQLGRNQGGIQHLQEALDIVRKIRSRACAPETTDLMAGGSTVDADLLERFILEERAREFAFEGKRWFDLLRNAKRDNYRGLNYLIEIAVFAAMPEKVYSLQTKWRSDHNSHYLPISESELKVNSALEQNPFYAIK